MAPGARRPRQESVQLKTPSVSLDGGGRLPESAWSPLWAACVGVGGIGGGDGAGGVGSSGVRMAPGFNPVLWNRTPQSDRRGSSRARAVASERRRSPRAGARCHRFPGRHQRALLFTAACANGSRTSACEERNEPIDRNCGAAVSAYRDARFMTCSWNRAALSASPRSSAELRGRWSPSLPPGGRCLARAHMGGAHQCCGGSESRMSVSSAYRHCPGTKLSIRTPSASIPESLTSTSGSCSETIA